MERFKADINGRDFDVQISTDSGTILLDGQAFPFDLAAHRGLHHLLVNNKSYNIELLGRNAETQTLSLRINGRQYDVRVRSEMDMLLQSLGLEGAATAKLREVKAPMPGLVFQVIAAAGDEVRKGDSLLILEAMKMENVIKSPADGRVKRIAVSQGLAVEKGQVLVEFD